MRGLLLQRAQNFCSERATATRKGGKIARNNTNVKAEIYSITVKSISFNQDLRCRRKTVASDAFNSATTNQRKLRHNNRLGCEVFRQLVHHESRDRSWLAMARRLA
jgi:hypothetical protein